MFKLLVVKSNEKLNIHNPKPWFENRSTHHMVQRITSQFCLSLMYVIILLKLTFKKLVTHNQHNEIEMKYNKNNEKVVQRINQ